METARVLQSRGCSCSYVRNLHRTTSVPIHRHQRSQHSKSKYLRDQHRVAILSSSESSIAGPEPQPPPKINVSGYTPADFVTYSSKPSDTCHHMSAVKVQAPASVCFSIWNNWNRLVDFLDLVCQIGLDPDQDDLALFQCFYRWGMMPVLEIVFLLAKTEVQENKLIRFESKSGMPLQGEVQFIEEEDGMSTTVIFKLEHQLPNLLADVSVKAFGVETSCRVIFGENLQQFRRIAEAMASGVAVDAQAEAEDGDMTVGIELLMEDMNGDDVAEDGSEVETLKEDDGLLEEDIHLQDEGEEEGLEEGDEEEEEEEAPTPVIKTASKRGSGGPKKAKSDGEEGPLVASSKRTRGASSSTALAEPPSSGPLRPGRPRKGGAQ